MKYGIIALWLLMLTACNQQDSVSDTSKINSAAPMAKMAADSVGGAQLRLTQQESAQGSEPAQSAAKKYIALRHHLQVETAPEKMQANFDAAIKQCEALNCQLLSANYNRQTPYSPPSASLSLRVPPKNVSLFLTGLAKNGEVI